MGRYLAMLLTTAAKLQKHPAGNLQNLQNPKNGGFVGFEGTPPGTFEKIALTPIAGLPPRSVSLADLSRLQKQLLPHLAERRDCVIEPHRYCSTAEADGWAYQCLLTDCEDADQLHADFVSAVIKARVWGIKRGFTELEALAHQREETGRETAGRPVYGIDNRPAELAFVNHFTVCAYCFPRSGKYCAEGRELHDLARLEALQ